MPEKVASGLYQTASEVVREGLRLLKERDERQQATLCEAIQDGLAQLEQGAYRDYIDATPKDLAQGVKQRGRERLAARQKA